MRETAPVLAQKFEHAAVLYGDTDEYLDAVLGFVAEGLERAEPVLVAVPGAFIASQDDQGIAAFLSRRG